ncbi:lipase maturation factor family protein [Granulicella sp. 5B5]|uniref:lipase maturation factor family protein n=1 Tax=Granulicella sp. 5B5 TaxID=1617967 RepID=UPI0015F45876|nr:lipase maturation factor family protein [Granulicella sp. 5B5]QMV18813.1 lipase maturation factor family protein [Granulicella sp. 5B5]
MTSITPSRPLNWLFDRDHGPADRLISRWLFLRALGLIYFSAFFALVFQVKGLIGSQGILPAAQYFARLHQLGPIRLWYAPSLLWLHPSDAMLTGLIWTGLIASLLVVANILPRTALLVCWLCFLSFVTTAQDFSMYQSDGMLLEAGFLALFVAPNGLFPGWARRSLASRAALFLLLWEWFRIYFESGVVKLTSGDPTWRNLTAMYEYYQNGPLPTWIGWYLQHLPHWFQRGTAGVTLFMELILIWMAFIPRRGWRLACFLIVTAWQIGVIATANYAFLNYLVLILAILLLDDATLLRFVPQRFRSGLNSPASTPTVTILPAAEEAPAKDVSSRPEARSAAAERPAFAPATEPESNGPSLGRHLSAIRLAITTVLLTWIAYVTFAGLIATLWSASPLPQSPTAALEPFRIANDYGLFATMTPHRYEIEFQGSNDGQTWTPYPFLYKPQDVHACPRIYAPYQPRFDWNLWFASLQPWQQSPIVPLTELRLLDNDPTVLTLFAGNPFAGHPPRYIRAVLWQYWFSTPEQKRTQHIWWTRQYLGTFAPTLTKNPTGGYISVADANLDGPPQD